AEDGIRDFHVTGVQTCALPIFEEVLTIRPYCCCIIGIAAFWLHNHVPLRLTLSTASQCSSGRNFTSPSLTRVVSPSRVMPALLRSEERRVGKECGAGETRCT